MTVAIDHSDIAKFLRTYLSHYDEAVITQFIDDHIKYGTLTSTFDDDGIVSAMRYNVTGETIHVIDLAIRPDKRSPKTIKALALITWLKFPYAKFFSFDRDIKYPHRKRRAYSLKTLLKGKTNGKFN